MPVKRSLFKQCLLVSIFPALIIIGCAHQNDVTTLQKPTTNIEQIRTLILQTLSENFQLKLTQDPADKKLIIESEQAHEANWLLEDAFTEFLTSRKDQTNLTIGKFNSYNYKITFRLIDVRIDYIQEKKFAFLHTDNLRRTTIVGFNLNIYDENNQFISNQMFSQLKTDSVLLNDIDYIENPQFKFSQADFSPGNQLSQLEPVFITSIIGSLVYLYYSSRHED